MFVRDISKHGAAIVADSWTASTAQIVAARPDLVIAAVPYQEKAVTEILKSGARFLGLAPKTLADIYTDIAAIAGIMGALGRGEEVIQEMARSDRGHPPANQWGQASSRLLRGMGQAVDCVTAMGRRVSGSGWRRVRRNSRETHFGCSNPVAKTPM